MIYSDFKYKRNVLILVFTSVLFIFSSGKIPADDGFFYLQIADNFVNGNGIKFNSLYETNGFHPLWEIICVFLAFINPFGKQYLIYFAWILQLIIFYKSMLLLQKFWSNSFFSLLPITFLTVVFCNLGTIYLSEAFINLFLLCLFLEQPKFIKENIFFTGILFGLIFLARLDNVFILLFLGIYVSFIQVKFSLRNALKLVLGFILITIPYLLFNQIEFGSIVPVSGKIKSFFPYFEMNGFNTYSKILLLTTVFYIICLLTFLKNHTYHSILLWFSLGTLCQLLYNIFFQSQIGQWYFVAQFLVFSFLLYDITEKIFYKIKFRKSTNLLLLFVCFTTCFLVGLIKMSSNFSLINLFQSNNLTIKDDNSVAELAKQLKNKLPKNAKIYIYDMPGKIAYYSNLDIIPADGLINNNDFSDELNKLGFEGYLRKNNIQYVIIPSHSEQDFEELNYAGLITSKQNNIQEVKIKDPYTKKIIGKLDFNNFKEIMVYPNPLINWQPTYNQVKVLKLK